MKQKLPTIVGLIPARSGSKRIRGKNIRPLAGHPLLAHTVSAALRSRIFQAVICCTDSRAYGRVAQRYGAEVIFRPKSISGPRSPDIEWVRHALQALWGQGRKFDAFSILRPTSPFRLPGTIRRAWRTFCRPPRGDSLRAVQFCRQHPAKMWRLCGPFLQPLGFGRRKKKKSVPGHSLPYAALPPIFAQDASLEIAWTSVPLRQKTISGRKVKPFFSRNWEGFDLNEPADWWVAERLIRDGTVQLYLSRERRKTGPTGGKKNS